MTDETFDRPNKPGIWQREGSESLIARNDRYYFYINGVNSCYLHSQFPSGQYRMISDTSGKQVCDPEEPWPPKVRIEKRRVVEWRDDTDGIMRVCYRRLGEEIRQPNDGVIIRYEIRDCKIEDGRVIQVIPVKEGE